MTEVTQSWNNVVRPTEQEWTGRREPVAVASFPTAAPDAFQHAARPLRPQDFADTGPPGSRPQQN